MNTISTASGPSRLMPAAPLGKCQGRPGTIASRSRESSPASSPGHPAGSWSRPPHLEDPTVIGSACETPGLGPWRTWQGQSPPHWATLRQLPGLGGSYSRIAEGIDLKSYGPQFESYPCHLLFAGPWISLFSSLNITISFWIMGYNTSFSGQST